MNYRVFVLILFFASDLLGVRSWQQRRKLQQAVLVEDQEEFTELPKQSPVPSNDTLKANQSKSPLLPEGAVLQDKAVVVVDGSERRHVICQSECNRVSIEGTPLTPDVLIDDELLFQEALRHNVPVDQTVAEKYISAISKQYNLSPAQVNGIFKQAGMTIQQGRDALMKMYAKNSITEHKIISRILVTEDMIVAYCKENPVYKPAKYQLKIAVVPYTDKPIEQQKAVIMNNVAKGYTNRYEWCDPFWLKESEIADDKQFIIAMQASEISKPEEAANGLEIIQLVHKKEQREVPLKKRYKEVVAQLREPKINEALEQYIKELRDRASITFLSNPRPPTILACSDCDGDHHHH